MIIRKTLYALTLIAYSLSLAHSVIPHHHHKTADEATAHNKSNHHHDSAHDHHHGNEESESETQDESNAGHLFFFSHDINADVLVQHSSMDSSVKVKKILASVSVKEQTPFRAISSYVEFHPPPDDQTTQSVTVPSNKLRGPPTLI
jgi:hypothetical protein